METLYPEDFKNKFKNSWTAAYKKIITMVDKDKIELVEYHPCLSGSQWIVSQYKNSSKLIIDAKRDGNKHTFLLNKGKVDLDLKPSINAAGIEEVSILDDKVKIVHAGFAGAGVGAAMCRGMAEGVDKVEIYDMPGGSKLGRAAVFSPKLEKLVIGIDDTDTKDKGATWTMAHNIGLDLSKMGFDYLDHVIVQLYPDNPHKTQNCVSIALIFAVESEKKNDLINSCIDLLKLKTLSDKTAIAILSGLTVPPMLREYSIQAKTSLISVEYAENLAKELNIDLISVTGDQGKVGALAALGLYDDLDTAVKIV